MTQAVQRPGPDAAAIAFDVFDPIPYGFFVGALVFDAVYAQSPQVMWFKAAAWLIAMGLVAAVLPRLINLARVWITRREQREGAALAGFWLNFLAIAAAIANAFVHSRDAYGVMPEGLWLSGLTVALLVLAKVLPAVQRARGEDRA